MAETPFNSSTIDATVKDGMYFNNFMHHMGKNLYAPSMGYTFGTVEKCTNDKSCA